jgi:hypothetical protein
VQMILKEGLPLRSDTLECTLPPKMLADDLGGLLKWYRTVIDALQHISREMWFMNLKCSMVHDAVITPDAEIQLKFFALPIRMHVSLCHDS